MLVFKLIQISKKGPRDHTHCRNNLIGKFHRLKHVQRAGKTGLCLGRKGCEGNDKSKKGMSQVDQFSNQKWWFHQTALWNTSVDWMTIALHMAPQINSFVWKCFNLYSSHKGFQWGYNSWLSNIIIMLGIKYATSNYQNQLWPNFIMPSTSNMLQWLNSLGPSDIDI